MVSNKQDFIVPVAKCGPGEEPDDNGGCRACAIDRYKPTSGFSECVVCPATTDTHNRTGQAQCGWYKFSPNQNPVLRVFCLSIFLFVVFLFCFIFLSVVTFFMVAVAQCGCGQEPNPDRSRTCVPCTSGSYKTSTGYGLCTQCPIGTNTRDLEGQCGCSKFFEFIWFFYCNCAVEICADVSGKNLLYCVKIHPNIQINNAS